MTKNTQNTYVYTNYVPERRIDRLTKGKLYLVGNEEGEEDEEEIELDGGIITDDTGDRLYIFIPSCCFLDSHPWTVVKESTWKMFWFKIKKLINSLKGEV
jgi:hypothetical protein